MSVLKRLCSVVTGNDLAQRALEYNVRFSQYLLGIGAGTRVHSSGEMALVRLVQAAQRQRAAQPGLPPVCVFDIGANVGQFAQLIQAHCDCGALELHSFEPGAAAFARLTAALPARPGLHLNHCAVGSHPGSATLYSDVPGSGLSSLTRRNLDHVGKVMALEETVEVCTIDDYCASQKIGAIDLLKIDVEGHEQEVLRGATRMFRENRIAAVTFEFGGCNIDTRTYFRDFWQFFDRLGMQLHRLTPRGFLRRIPAYREGHEQFLTTNFLACRPASDPRATSRGLQRAA